jgi:Flp pilus assembly protein TadD
MHCWSDHRPAPIALPRRLALAVLSLAIAFVSLHGWIAMGLVSRGDDVLRAGQQERALAFYARAAWLDPGWDAATDRYAFAAAMTRDPRVMESAVARATILLARHPASRDVRWDRAVCLLHLGRSNAAFEDLVLLARARRTDWRMNDMARRVALTLGRPSAAREFDRFARPR